MGVLIFNDELVSPVVPARLFKALIKDADNLIPKLIPQGLIDIEVIQGEGGAGTIRKITFTEGDKKSSIKTHVDELNEETLTYKYTVLEGDSLDGKFEKIAHEVQFVTSESGGTISKTLTQCYPLGDDVAISEEEVKVGKAKADGLFKVVEAYLLENPEAYNA